MKRNCLYCGNEFEPNKPKQKFCSPIHRVYWHRMNKVAPLAKKIIYAPVKQFYDSEKKNFKDEPQKIQEHRLYKDGDPAEGTMAFMMKYNCSNYIELEELLKN